MRIAVIIIAMLALAVLVVPNANAGWYDDTPLPPRKVVCPPNPKMKAPGMSIRCYKVPQ